MKRHKRHTRRKHLLRQIVVVVLLLVLGFVFVQTASYMVNQGEIPVLSSFNLFKKEADTSLGWNLILVNDDYSVPNNYEVELTELSNGEKVDTRIYPQLQQMFDDARAAGLELFVREGYRTTQDQKQIMEERIQQYRNEGYSRSEAKELAEKYVAVPGTSEHELGIAVDINADTSKCSSDAVYTWLANNAYRYGFIKRYPSEKTEITGVNNEPWHYRYVGVEAAKEIQERGICLEEYIDLLKS
ncbi:M15 family metallopeptidase [Sellimonas sp.]|uniref:M15 family metallopeptidase n=1 Tax=Sellimonas sp. TaxID=2021466 RepID=UPI00257F0E66|nr:M15 family metallopeptidase [Sellimonas sp.]